MQYPHRSRHANVRGTNTFGEKVTIPGSGPAARTDAAASQSEPRSSVAVKRSSSERVRSREPEATAPTRSEVVDVEASPSSVVWAPPLGAAEIPRPWFTRGPVRLSRGVVTLWRDAETHESDAILA